MTADSRTLGMAMTGLNTPSSREIASTGNASSSAPSTADMNNAFAGMLDARVSMLEGALNNATQVTANAKGKAETAGTKVTDLGTQITTKGTEISTKNTEIEGKKGQKPPAEAKRDQPVPPPQYDPDTGTILNQAEIDRVNAEKQEGAAEVARLDAEIAAAEAEKTRLEGEKSKLEAEKAAAETEKTTAEAEADKAKTAEDEAKKKLEEAKAARDKAKAAGGGFGPGGGKLGGADGGGGPKGGQGGGQPGGAGGGNGGGNAGTASGYLDAAKAMIRQASQSNQDIAVHWTRRKAKWASMLSIFERAMAYVEAAMMDQTIQGTPQQQESVLVKTIAAAGQGESRVNMQQADQDGQEYKKEQKDSGQHTKSA